MHHRLLLGVPVQATAESTKKEKKKDTDVNGATETDAAQKKKETVHGAKGEDSKETEGISIGPTRDGKSLPVKRTAKETRAWEGPTPVRRNRHDRPQPEWAHDSESEVEEDGCRMLTTADTKSADEGTKEVLGVMKGEVETKEPTTPGEQAAYEKATGDEKAAEDDPSVFEALKARLPLCAVAAAPPAPAPALAPHAVDVPLSTPTSDEDQVAKGFMAAEEITAHEDAAALFAPLFGEITAHADDCAVALTFDPLVTDEQRPRTSQLLAAQLLEPLAITTAGAAITTAAHAPPAVTDEKESFSRTPFSKRPISKIDNAESPAQKKLQTLHVAAMHPGSPGAEHPPPAL